MLELVSSVHYDSSRMLVPNIHELNRFVFNFIVFGRCDLCCDLTFLLYYRFVSFAFDVHAVRLRLFYLVLLKLIEILI